MKGVSEYVAKLSAPFCVMVDDCSWMSRQTWGKDKYDVNVDINDVNTYTWKNN